MAVMAKAAAQLPRAATAVGKRITPGQAYIRTMKESNAIGLLYALMLVCSLLIFGFSGAAAGTMSFAVATIIYIGAVTVLTMANAHGKQIQDDLARVKAIERARVEVCANLADLLPKEKWEIKAIPGSMNTRTTHVDVEFARSLNNEPRSLHILDRMATRTAELHTSWKAAVADLGKVDDDIATVVHAEAARAATAIVAEARAAHEMAEAERRRIAAERAPDIVGAFTRRARAIVDDGSSLPILPAPSTSATLSRLIALGERALATDPGLVDDAGGRIDDLVRRHLPRLARRHDEAAQSATIENLGAVDAEFEHGVQAGRDSIAEALARGAKTHFDDLKTEVAFLRARRGE